MGWALFSIIFIIMGFTPKTHDLIILVQDYRTEYKVPLLIEDPRLECAAKVHLAYILSNKACVYIGTQGETIRDTLKFCGFEPKEVKLLLYCQELSLEAWFERIYLYKIEAKTLRDYRWKYIGAAGDNLWFTMILAR